MNQVILGCNLSRDTTMFWFADNHVFSLVDSTFPAGTGLRHDIEDVIALRDWLNEVIKELEPTP